MLVHWVPGQEAQKEDETGQKKRPSLLPTSNGWKGKQGCKLGPFFQAAKPWKHQFLPSVAACFQKGIGGIGGQICNLGKGLTFWYTNGYRTCAVFKWSISQTGHIWKPGVKRGYKEKAVWLGKRSESCTSPFVKYSFQSHFNLYQHDTLLKYSTTLQIHVSTSNLPAIASWRVKKKTLGTRNEVAQCLSLVTCTWCHGPRLMPCSWTDQILPLGKYPNLTFFGGVWSQDTKILLRLALVIACYGENGSYTSPCLGSLRHCRKVAVREDVRNWQKRMKEASGTKCMATCGESSAWHQVTTKICMLSVEVVAISCHLWQDTLQIYIFQSSLVSCLFTPPPNKLETGRNRKTSRSIHCFLPCLWATRLKSKPHKKGHWEPPCALANRSGRPVSL